MCERGRSYWSVIYLISDGFVIYLISDGSVIYLISDRVRYISHFIEGGEALIMARIQLQHSLGPDAKYADGLFASPPCKVVTTTGGYSDSTPGPAIIHARHHSNHSDAFEDIDLNAVDDDEVSSYERIDPHYYSLKKKKREQQPGGGGGGGGSGGGGGGVGASNKNNTESRTYSIENSCDLASEGHLSSYAALDDTIAEAHLRSSGNLLSSSDYLLRSSGNLLSPEQHHRASGNLRSSADRF